MPNPTSKGKRRAIPKNHPWRKFKIVKKSKERIEESKLYFENKQWVKNTMNKRKKGIKCGL